MKSKVKIKHEPKKALKKLEALNKRMKGNNQVLAGLPKGSNDYPDGTNVIMVGAVHEFGSPSRNVPQRSFLRSTLKENRKKYKTFIKNLVKQIVNGKIDKDKMLDILGLKLQSDIRNKITDIKTPPLKNREGNPLIDTGHLRQSITYEIRK